MNIKESDFNEMNPAKEHMCVFKCVAEKANYLDANGNTKPGVLASTELAQMEIEKFKECFAITSEDKCEQIYKQGRCAMDKGLVPPALH